MRSASVKNIVIVLVLAVGGVVAGWLGTMLVVQHQQNAAYSQPVPTGDASQDSRNAYAYLARASGDSAKRQTDALIGGGVGLVAGVVLGIAVSSATGKSAS
jgi:hypothetical protein